MKKITFFFLLVFSVGHLSAQDDPYVSLEIPAQNMLKFNRFMINPTFSTVRENKSYINVYHRNQWIQYEDAFNTYLLSYSGRIGDRTGLGLSLYHQSFGTISNFGVLANYAYGIRFSDNTVFTMGFNLSYYKSGFDQNQSVTTTPDPRLAELEGNSLLGVQPGFNLAIGNFDIGFYAENLFDYNLKTSKSLTSFSEKTFSGHLQYTKQLKDSDGLLQDGRLMLLARARKQPEIDVNLSGSLILDLPKLGWVQGGFDDYYGVSIGVGFNLNRRISLGYTYERGLNSATENLGPTHEISFAYSFEPNLTDQMVIMDDGFDSIDTIENSLVDQNSEEKSNKNDTTLTNEKENAENKTTSNISINPNEYKAFNKKQKPILLAKDAEIEQLKKDLEEANMLIDELLFTQDSIEKARVADLERRFLHLMQLVKRTSEENPSQNNATSQDNTNLKGSSKQINEEKLALSTTPQPVSPKKEIVTEANISNTTSVSSTKVKASHDLIKKEIQKNNIKSESLFNIKGVESGYYLIVNVFGTEAYFNKFMKRLSNDGIDPNSFVNPNNKWNYVYLQRYDTWQDAVAAHKSKFNGAYADDMWIMNVDNGDGNSEYAYNQNKPTRKVAQTLVEQKGIQEQNKNTSKEAAFNQPIEKDDANTVISKNLKTNILSKETITTSAKKESDELYKKELKKNNIKSASISNVSGVRSGYYLITNVFGTERFFNKFVKDLTKKGVPANHFLNPKNNWKYVYLQRFDTWQEAISAHKSKFNGVYHDDMWIMNVDNGDTSENQNKSISQLNNIGSTSGLSSENSTYVTLSNKGARAPKVVTDKIHSIEPGYYIIANVFSESENADSFISHLKNKGLDPKSFLNPKNNYRYVYLKKTETWNAALQLYHSNLERQYYEDMWIMNILEP
ncbi:PorP/SprF family type IX secretion system membrane protein [Geojedonia litorea]|uniref:PorP/SprF family type IX secretion system membrane protein n=1 Tax=Geojedonia litorea TaxID=1268269 RepID=A0ABV9N3E2_9FLAO